MSLDYQDSLLRDINKDLLLTNANLKTSTEEVIRQGGQLTNIQGNLDDANKHIKKTDNTMFVIEWRARCHRIVLYSTIVLEFITIIVLFIVAILNNKKRRMAGKYIPTNLSKNKECSNCSNY